MGILSKLMKNPVMQMLAPMALSMAVPGIGGMFASKGALGGLPGIGGLSSLFGGMNPMAANALKQSLLGYGTGLLTGAEDPGKQAMYSGIASLPFSYMSAARTAADWNRLPRGVEPVFKDASKYQRGFGAGMVDPGLYDAAGLKPTNVLSHYAQGVDPRKVSAWDILTAPSSGLDVQLPGYEHPSRMINAAGGKRLPDFMAGEPKKLTADIFTKTIPGEATLGEYGILTTDPQVKADWIPTLASQGAGALGEYMDTQDIRAEKAWRRNKEKRRKELAWMYGVPEDMVEGEMYNPWYTGGGFWNKGGIASLENGGGVSGPGTGTSDSIDAKLSDGEFVMTAKAVENLGNGDRYEGARKMYGMMNMLDPESETMSEVV